jgi:hypothetical protein
MDWPHTEETTIQHHQTGPQMEPTRQKKQRTCRDVLSGIQRSGDFHVSIEVNVLGQ